MNKIKIYLQSPWRKGGECSYYKFLREDLPQNIEFVNKESSTIIQNKRNLKLNNFLKKKVREIIKKAYPSMPNAHKSPSGNYDLIHCAHCLSKNKNKPWVTDIEYIEQLWAMGWNDGKLNSKKEVLKILKSKNCKKILPWTNWVKEKIIKEFPEIKEKVEVLYPGIPLPKNKNKKKKDKLVILYASRNFYFKGGLYAIETMDKVTKDNPKVEGWIVSEVPKEIHEKYKSNKQIKFIGMVSQKKLFEEIYPSSDIFLYPSFTDTFGFAITEAMSFGLPVISTEGQSRKELIKDGETGFVVKTGLGYIFNPEVLRKIDLEILKNLVKKTIELINDDSLRLSMGDSARKEIESGKFSIKERNSKLVKIYSEAMEDQI